MVHALN